MPKDYINYTNDGASFSVHWTGPDGGTEAQLAIHVPRADLEAYVKDLSKEDHTVTWYSPSLTRHELQNLIRLGRRARDAVYGADE